MTNANRVGLLVVHGIGEQRPLDTVEKVVRALRAAMPDLREPGRRPDELVITLEDPASGVTVNVYEVYWADLLSGPTTRGSFAPEKVQTVAWFPWLNWRTHLYPRPRGLEVAIWTAILVPLSAVLYVGLLGAALVGVIIADLKDRSKPTSPTGTFLERVRQTAEAGRGGEYPWLDQQLDLIAGDVFSYADGSAPTAAMPSTADEIRARFYSQAARAVADGCDEVDVLAHSLGTVVAFNAVTGFRLPDAEPGPDDVDLRISRLWTIGSPLEKFAFLWPSTTTGDPLTAFRREGTRVVATGRGGDRPRWVNFDNPLDLVAGRLLSFREWDVEHQRVWAAGVARSHTVYERNRQVVASLTEALFGTAAAPALSRKALAFGVLTAIGESLGTLLALTLVMALGAAILVGTIAFLPWLVGTTAGLVVSEAAEAAIKDWGFLIFGAMMVGTLLVLSPRLDAGRQHLLWRPGGGVGAGPPDDESHTL